MKIFSAIFAALVAVTPLHAAPTKLQFIVPAYFYPSYLGSDWDRMTAAVTRGVGVTAIMNPASGPGVGGNSDYVTAIAKFRTAGGRVLGYVPSGYIGRNVNAGSSCRPASGTQYTASDVVACAGTYKQNYAIDGIFVDEMGAPNSSTTLAELTSFYQSVYDGIKATDSQWTITGNPGTSAPIELLRQGSSGGADSLITFENVASQYASTWPPSYAASFDAARFGNILHTASPGFDFTAAATLARQRNVGYLYVTDAVLPNPYDRLPTNWEAQVTTVLGLNAAVPEPQSWSLLIVGFALVGATLRQRHGRALATLETPQSA